MIAKSCSKWRKMRPRERKTSGISLKQWICRLTVCARSIVKGLEGLTGLGGNREKTNNLYTWGQRHLPTIYICIYINNIHIFWICSCWSPHVQFLIRCWYPKLQITLLSLNNCRIQLKKRLDIHVLNRRYSETLSSIWRFQDLFCQILPPCSCELTMSILNVTGSQCVHYSTLGKKQDGHLQKNEGPANKLFLLWICWHGKHQTPILLHENVVGFLSDYLKEKAEAFGYKHLGTMRATGADCNLQVNSRKRVHPDRMNGPNKFMGISSIWKRKVTHTHNHPPTPVFQNGIYLTWKKPYYIFPDPEGM